MKYTDEEKQTAQALNSNQGFLELIAKVFLDTEDKLTDEFVQGKTNEELGEIVRANNMAEQKVKLRFNQLRMLGQKVEKGSHKVPK